MNAIWAATATGTEPISGTLIFLGLLVACVGLFFAMSRSLRRMRSNAGSGRFGRSAASADRFPPATTTPPPADPRPTGSDR